MQDNVRKPARAIAKAQDEQIRKFGLIALAVTMTAACLYGFVALVF